MTGSRDYWLTLDAFDEPTLIVQVDGSVLDANRSATDWFGRPLAGADLFSLAGDDSPDVGRFLLRSSRTTHPLVGALSLVGASGELLRVRCYGKLLQPPTAERPALVLLRFARDIDIRFRALTMQIHDLNNEVKRHLQTQLLLQRTVSERELLLRELSHRVMNNMQMLSALLAAAQRETDSERAREVLRDAGNRVAAMAAAQRALYRADSLKTVDSRQLLERICSHIREVAAKNVAIEIEADPIEMGNDVAVPLALILNELLMNSVKHGVRDDTGSQIAVKLEQNNGGLVLRVEDNGPGFELSETHKRASGLGLVRGLVRQLGGSFSVERRSGACCVVRIESGLVGSDA